MYTIGVCDSSNDHNIRVTAKRLSNDHYIILAGLPIAEGLYREINDIYEGAELIQCRKLILHV